LDLDIQSFEELGVILRQVVLKVESTPAVNMFKFNPKLPAIAEVDEFEFKLSLELDVEFEVFVVELVKF
jgi:hypothetical protein